ncbi:MAG: hypothetical protein EOP35_04020, partial [Rubrivivax sp.]
MNRALLFSLVTHGLLLSLTFGGQRFGLTGLSLPWQARQAEVQELRVVLQPGAAAGESQPAEQPGAVPPPTDAKPAVEAPEGVVPATSAQEATPVLAVE